MGRIQEAVCWYKMLTSELGENTTWGTPGEGGERAKKRVRALIELFFALSDEMHVTRLLEIGAHDAETSKRFVASAPNRIAAGFDASPSVVQRVTEGGLPERFELYNFAIGTAKDSVKFFSPRDPKFAVWGSTARRGGFDEVEEIIVPAISMDEAANRLTVHSEIRQATRRNMAVWIDVEGTALDVLGSGRAALADEVCVLYVEVNDKNAYQGSANVIKVIEAMLTLGFVPLSRDNEYPDAWNLIFVHETYFDEPREAFQRYTYDLMPGSPT